MQFFISAPPS
ncbi:TPA: hypothetical protein ANIA_11674 [Aspergillus nidulans FGSC A4]|uniref:Uncharacterized protein n=1 Tax=Emericella nidulans (strain FGSC A4 / ATCC 38163 / CBS 112.46 / NRRL 194 / M139) TaxID=227321 RepID=C8VD14_EMENI|nr:TPA: hypothetical protein ANIA_11674 [Aspergillus nidulans FGSC A4]